MKKYFVIGIASLAILTGCGKKEVVECTNNQKVSGVEMNTVLKAELQGNKFKKINMTIDAVLPESMQSKKDTFVKTFERQYSSFETTYGVKPVVSETSNGVKIDFEMTAEQAKKFSGSKNDKATRKDVIEIFEKQGYTCK